MKIINLKTKIAIYFILLTSMFSFGQSPNDQCSGAIALTLGASCTTGSIVAGNTTTGDPTTKPSCWQFSNDNGIWYKFTATVTNALVNVKNVSLTNNPMAAIYNGGAAPGTCPVAAAVAISGGCLAASGGADGEMSVTGLTVGNVYYILVDGYTTQVGNFCIRAFNGPPTTTASVACPAGISNIVTLMTCADVGTSNLELSSGTVVFSEGGTTASPAPSCGGGNYNGSWTHYDLATGVTALTFNWETSYGGSTDLTGGTGIFAQVYQGASCAALTSFSCVQVGSASNSSFIVNSTVIQNLNPAQDAWVYMFHNANSATKYFTLPFDVVGSVTPVNDACSGSSSSTVGCNLGAIGDFWGTGGTTTVSAPETALAGGSSTTCAGSGGWTSNENTVWYTFTAGATTASISVSNVLCNNGLTGLAQFAVFTSCACPTANNYVNNACFKGCAVGSGTINLGSLTSGQTVYLALDGSAGDVCKMNFNITNLTPLPVTWMDFHAKKNNNDVKLFWTTIAEENSRNFEIERTFDGIYFNAIGSVKAAGNSGLQIDYNFTDFDVKNKQVYYRIKQFDIDGTFSYSKMIYVDFDAETKEPEIFFNASDKVITIKSYSKGFNNYDVEIIDLFGKPAMEAQKTDFETENTFSIPVHSLPNGVYIVNMKNKDGYRSYIKKIVIY